MTKIPKIGIMEGRLSSLIGDEIQAFPQNSWNDEFEKASKCGFELIEWIFDLYEKNPILDDDGIKKIQALSEKHGIKINSICADYFMKKKLFNVPDYELRKNLDVLKNILQRSYQLGIEILEIPFVDSSSLKNKNDEDQLIFNLQKIMTLVEDLGIKLTLETDLPPSGFKSLLTRFDHPNIKANYDTGNSASLGYDVEEELKVLGSWIANIHIKDRVYGGKTVPLGTGDVNFDSFFSILSQINFNGDLIIQGAREFSHSIKPETTCTKYLNFVKQYVDKYF